MSEPKRIQRKRTKGWKMPPNAIYVGRPTVFGNPFTVEEVTRVHKCAEKQAREIAIIRYEGWLKNWTWRGYKPAKREEILRRLSELRGKDLACWCDEDSPCHGDILLKIANEGGTDA